MCRDSRMGSDVKGKERGSRGGGNSLFPDPGVVTLNSVCFSVGILYFKEVFS